MKRKSGKALRKSRAVFAAIFSMLILLCTGCSGASSGVETYQEAKDGVVMVRSYLKRTAAAMDGEVVALDWEEEWLGSGTGFFVGENGENPQYLITNHHVVETYLDIGAGEEAEFTDGNYEGVIFRGKCYLRVYYDSSDYDEAYIVGYDDKADVAVLRLASPTEKRKALKICSPDNSMVGSTAYALGYPGIADNDAVDAVSFWGKDDMTITSGIISRLATTSGSGVRQVQIDINITNGNSGGPLVNEKGAVLGINTWGYSDMKYAVNIDEAVTLLRLHNVPYVNTADDAGGSGSSRILLVGIGVLAAAVLAVVIIMAVKAGKNKKAAPQTTQNDVVQEQKGASYLPTMPVESASPAAQKNAGAAAWDSGYRLQGVSGALEGRRFMIRKDSPLILGRNGNVCNVTFPAGTAGVSGSHCQVWFDNGIIYIKDLGSSHGTFLASGARLSSGQALQLKPGESFSLGSENETLVLVQKGGG